MGSKDPLGKVLKAMTEFDEFVVRIDTVRSVPIRKEFQGRSRLAQVQDLECALIHKRRDDGPL